MAKCSTATSTAGRTANEVASGGARSFPRHLPVAVVLGNDEGAEPMMPEPKKPDPSVQAERGMRESLGPLRFWLLRRLLRLRDDRGRTAASELIDGPARCGECDGPLDADGWHQSEFADCSRSREEQS